MIDRHWRRAVPAILGDMQFACYILGLIGLARSKVLHDFRSQIGPHLERFYRTPFDDLVIQPQQRHRLREVIVTSRCQSGDTIRLQCRGCESDYDNR